MNFIGAAGRKYVSTLNHKVIQKDYYDGLSMKVIGKKYDISHTTVKKILIELGTKIRSKIEADRLRGKNERTGKNIKCANCGKLYYVFQGYLDQGRGKFCSQTCHIAYVANNITRTCEYCKKSFSVPNHWQNKNAVRFCSTKCYHGWQTKKARVELNCASCGKYMTKPRGRFNQVKGDKHFCSQECSQDYRSREKHHNWKGGITPLAELIRGHSKTRRWVKAVFKRDNYICRKCGAYGVDINCHHQRSFSTLLQEFLTKHGKLDPNNDIQALLRRAVRHKLFFDPDNGITLCTECHDAVHEEQNVK